MTTVASLPATVGVLGGGRMRAGIAHAFLMAGCSVVVEAVPEIWDVKVSSLRAVEMQLRPGAYLASNSSSVAKTGLAAKMGRPQNFIGLHFFNPVPSSTLIEGVIAAQTSPDQVAIAQGWATALGKTAVVVNDAPGFASSRLGVTLALQATLGKRFAPPQILGEKVARGELGRKTGRGFFDWN